MGCIIQEQISRRAEVLPPEVPLLGVFNKSQFSSLTPKHCSEEGLLRVGVGERGITLRLNIKKS